MYVCMYGMYYSAINHNCRLKLLLYKAILKYIPNLFGLIGQLWGTVCNSNIEILQRFQNKYLRIIVNAPWYSNDTLHRDLNHATH